MSTVASKLGIRPSTRIAVDGLELDIVRALLEHVPRDALLVRRDGTEVDQLILAASGLDDLRAMLSHAWDEVAPGGRLWVWYRKGAAKKMGAELPLHRDTLQLALAELSLVGVTLVSVDTTWSSMRVRPL
jgi:hypothetical protein